MKNTDEFTDLDIFIYDGLDDIDENKNDGYLDSIIEWLQDNDGSLFEKQHQQKGYVRQIFEDHFINNKSIKQLSEEQNISYWSVRNTVKIIKEQIKQKYETRRLNISNN